MKIILGCQKNDELENLCKVFFGEKNIEVLSRNGILGLDEIAIIISLTELTIATVSFLYSVLACWKPSQNSNQETTESAISTVTRRVIITKEGDINLEGYSAEEVERILKSLEKNQNDR